MEWGQLKNFIWFWAAPAALALFFLAHWRKKEELKRFGDLALVERLVMSFNAAARFWKRAFLLLALAGMVLALAQPHFRKKETRVERKGIDIILAVDVSNSMMAKDIPPTRLEKAKLELSALIDKLKGNRLGVVAFAGDAVIQCPLTLDRNAVKLFLSTVNPNLVEYQGTDIGKSMEVATQAFQTDEKGSKALIILTDGEDHNPQTPELIKKTKDAGIRIFTIGIGTPSGSTVPEATGQGYKKDHQGQPVLSRLNESLLKRIARETGGVYYRSSRGELEIDRLTRQIGQITQKDLQSDWAVEYEESYQIFVALALFLLATEMLVSERKNA